MHPTKRFLLSLSFISMILVVGIAIICFQLEADFIALQAEVDTNIAIQNSVNQELSNQIEELRGGHDLRKSASYRSLNAE